MISTIRDVKPHRSLRVLKAAEELIIEPGFTGLNLDMVVERAGCSKSTVYEFFGSKEGLLIAMLEQLIEEFQQQIEESVDSEKTIEQGLYAYTKLSLKRVLSEQHISLIRAILYESARTPSIGKTYYKAGPSAAIQQVAGYLKKKAPASDLRIDNPLQAAKDFYQLIFGLVYAYLFGAGKTLSGGAIEKEAKRIVDTFIKSYTVDSAHI